MGGDGLGADPDGMTLDEVRKHPDGLRLAELDGGRLDSAVTTPSGAIELVHDLFVDDVPPAAGTTGPPPRSRCC